MVLIKQKWFILYNLLQIFNTVIVIFHLRIGRCLSCWSKIPCGLQHQRNTSIKTSWPADTATSSEGRQIGAYSIGLTIPGKLNCTNNYYNKAVVVKVPFAVWQNERAISRYDCHQTCQIQCQVKPILSHTQNK